MAKILLGLIAAGFIIFFVLRMMPRSTPEADPAEAEVENLASGSSASVEAATGDSRFQQLMRKMTGEEGAVGRSEEGLRQFVQRVDPNQLTFRELSELFQALADDPETGLALMDRVLEDPDRRWKPTEREKLLRRAGALAAAADFGSLASRLDALETFADRSGFVQGAAEVLADQGIEESLMWVESLGETALQAPAMYGVGKAWVQKETSSAIQWAEGLEDPESKRHGLGGLVAGFALEDPEQAYAYARGASSELSDGLIVEVADAISLTDPKQASEWVVTAVGGSKQKAVLEESVERWAEQDFDEVEKWSWLVANSDLRDTVRISLADYWSHDDPEKATKWAADFPTKDARARALAKTLTQWAQFNPQEAASWFQRRPVDLEQIRLLKQALRTLGEEDLAAAEAWVNEMTEPTFKQIGQRTIQSLP
ncbi:MAG: hypothetical protein M2R45_02786 [Verrucomicrobia subdivision 3 bacterium]|nr:hypothetical protein [Limisphaerales bacterium]MCS1414336.1 hypothetical protein [Limisphaerales bacterium]